MVAGSGGRITCTGLPSMMRKLVRRTSCRRTTSVKAASSALSSKGLAERKVLKVLSTALSGKSC